MSSQLYLPNSISDPQAQETSAQETPRTDTIVSDRESHTLWSACDPRDQAVYMVLEYSADTQVSASVILAL